MKFPWMKAYAQSCSMMTLIMMRAWQCLIMGASMTTTVSARYLLCNRREFIQELLSIIIGAFAPMVTHIHKRSPHVSWEHRGQKHYYYRVKRDKNGCLVKTYYGTGFSAHYASAQDAQQRAIRESRRAEHQHL